MVKVMNKRQRKRRISETLSLTALNNYLHLPNIFDLNDKKEKDYVIIP